ncbi:hypothetical protein J6590_024786 [Homalodisca vitripennis]|nr:hypothetical protein J6590_024780 [Homalodisca vitripennis]KAG8317559.1 hypothetical protein J6590_024786 [Homalodisca vitripennis]
MFSPGSAVLSLAEPIAVSGTRPSQSSAEPDTTCTVSHTKDDIAHYCAGLSLSPAQFRELCREAGAAVSGADNILAGPNLEVLQTLSQSD